MKESEVKKAVREYMKRLGYLPYPKGAGPLERNRAWTDDVFAPKEVVLDREVRKKLSLIMEYKAPKRSLHCLNGIGQLSYYSFKMGIRNCILAIPYYHYLNLKDFLDYKMIWMGLIIVKESGEVEVVKWPGDFIPKQG